MEGKGKDQKDAYLPLSKKQPEGKNLKEMQKIREIRHLIILLRKNNNQ